MAQIWHCCGCGIGSAAAAPIRPLAWELARAEGAALGGKNAATPGNLTLSAPWFGARQRDREEKAALAGSQGWALRKESRRWDALEIDATECAREQVIRGQSTRKLYPRV